MGDVIEEDTSQEVRNSLDLIELERPNPLSVDEMGGEEVDDQISATAIKEEIRREMEKVGGEMHTRELNWEDEGEEGDELDETERFRVSVKVSPKRRKGRNKKKATKKKGRTRKPSKPPVYPTHSKDEATINQSESAIGDLSLSSIERSIQNLEDKIQRRLEQSLRTSASDLFSSDDEDFS